jgi:Carboxypeptidase regulatory-like domain
MKRARLIGALFACVLLAACNDSALPPGGTYQSVQGLVLDAVTNQPVAGATVTIDTVLTTTTDSTGKFSFKQVPVGTVDYVVSAQGYKTTQSIPVHLAPDKPLSLTVTLSH